MLKKLKTNKSKNVLPSLFILLSTSIVSNAIAQNEQLELPSFNDPSVKASPNSKKNGNFFELPKLPSLDRGIIGLITDANKKDKTDDVEKEVQRVLQEFDRKSSQPRTVRKRFPVTSSKEGKKGLFKTGKPIPFKRPVPAFTTIQDSNELIHKKQYESKNSHLPPVTYKNEYVELLFNSAANGDLNLIRSSLSQLKDVDIRDSNGNTPLIQAAMAGNQRSLATLLGMGANVNAVNKANINALYVTSKLGRADLSKLLINKGANPNINDVNGLTPLMLAAQNDSHILVKELLDAGANKNAINYEGDNALHIAVKNSSYSSILTLVRNGAYVNSQNKKGYTPLMLSAFVDNVLTTEALLNAGSDTKLTDSRGRTAQEIARARNSLTVARLINDHRSVGGNDINYVSKRSFAAQNLDGSVDTKNSNRVKKSNKTKKKIYYARQPKPVLKPSSRSTYGLKYPRSVKIKEDTTVNSINESSATKVAPKVVNNPVQENINNSVNEEINELNDALDNIYEDNIEDTLQEVQSQNDDVINDLNSIKDVPVNVNPNGYNPITEELPELNNNNIQNFKNQINNISDEIPSFGNVEDEVEVNIEESVIINDEQLPNIDADEFNFDELDSVNPPNFDAEFDFDNNDTDFPEIPDISE